LFIRKIFPRLMALLLVLALSGVAQAATGRQKLDAFFKGLKTMRAEFVQKVLDKDQRVKEQSEGVMYLSRPGHFRLEYTKPYSQLYVADGQKLWMYDKDLEQVTVRPQADTLGSTPALLLSGGVPLDRDFNIKDLGVHEGGLTWLELTPKKKDPTFSDIRLALDKDGVRAMQMTDNFGQITRMYFTSIERNPAISPDRFRFTPPPGVDVVGEGQ